MSRTARLGAVLLALLLPASGMRTWATQEHEPDGAAALQVLTSHVGPWIARADQTLSEDALRIIAPDAHVLRRYEAPGKGPIWLYAGFYGGRAGYGKGAHDPEICYPAQGWEILDARAQVVHTANGGTIPGRLLRAHLGSQEELVVYWFQPAQRWPASPAVEELMRVVDAIRGRPQYAFIRLSMPAVGPDPSVDDILSFAGEIAPVLRRGVESL